MALKPSMFFGKVMHKRLFPQENGFTYNIYYLAFPLSHLNKLPLPLNRFGLLSFYKRDHALRDGGDLEAWAREILERYKVDQAAGEICILTLPRVLGYIFNPVTFWFCLDKSNQLRAVVCEVNNTFGETHSYLVRHADHRVIQSNEELEGEKVFHVSPFLPRNGHYSFRFNLQEESCGVWINYHCKTGEKQLVTALVGKFSPMNKSTLRRAFWCFPLITLRAVVLIHWQAIKLLFKGCKYIAKPKQKQKRVTSTKSITKM